MKDWYVGQKVVCIEYGILTSDPRCDPWYESFKIPLIKNKIYTIREILSTPRGIALRLIEVTCISTLTKQEYNWADIRFRPLEEKKIDISVFHSILDKINDTVKTPILEKIEC